MIYVASFITLLIGYGLIHISWKEYQELVAEISDMKSHSMKKNRMKIMAEVTALEINTDFPFQLFDWPLESDFENKEDYKKAFNVAQNNYQEELAKIEIFGNMKIEYRYIAPDGYSYLSRTISRVPTEQNLKSIYQLKIGQKIPAFLNPDDYSDSILKSNKPEDFEKYQKTVTKAQKAKIAIGVLIGLMALFSPWTFTLLPI